MLRTLTVVLLVSLVAWLYQEIQPSPPRICGTSNGPPVTSSRITLKDGRHISYIEFGVPKEKANYRIIFMHGFGTCKYDVLPISQELLEELGIYYLSFDRPGYGESDPNPRLSEKDTAIDVEELADKLQLGSKFHVIGYSMGGELVWSCLKFIPHRLAGAALVSPVANYWWPGFPANVSKATYDQQLIQDQWAVRVAHYAPWLIYWWNTQKWFPSSSVINFSLDIFSVHDKMLLSKLAGDPHQISEFSNIRCFAGGVQLNLRVTLEAQVLQQGVFYSLHRDLLVGFGHWEFDPLALDNPFANDEGSVHLWHGTEDLVVPVTLSQSISKKLPWIHYHEIPDGGHLLPLTDGIGDIIVKALLVKDP